jgi:multidrug efflux pump subunit AcrA (membrane-fusion protein)
MSNLGKILLYVAVAGAIAAFVAGGFLIKKRWDDAAILAQTVQAKTQAEQATKKAQAEKAAADAAKADSDKQLADAKTQVDDLTSKLAEAKTQQATAASALSTATDAAKAAQDKLDALNKQLDGKSVDDYKTAEAKAESDLAAAQSEQKILQDQLQGSQEKVTTLMDAINRSKSGGTMPGISGKVTFVDHTWNFVVLDVGVSSGVVPNGELIVYRGRSFLGKIRVTKVDNNDAVAEILPDIKGDIQVGDSVLN